MTHNVQGGGCILVRFALFLGAAMAASLCSANPADRERSPGIKNVYSQTIEVLGSQGKLSDLTQGQAGSAPQLAVAVAERGSGKDPGGSGCLATQNDRRHVTRTSRMGDRLVDACGQFPGSQEAPPFAVGDISPGSPSKRAAVATATIDRMTTRLKSGYHQAGGGIALVGSAETYELSDGSQWSSGAGSYRIHDVGLTQVDVTGSTIRYVLASAGAPLLYEQTDYDSGDHSAQGTLGAAGSLVIEAQLGSTTATLRGNAVVVSNEATWYGDPRFNYYTAIVGSVVPFEIVFTLWGDTWTPDIFERAFAYGSTGWVDFAHPVSTPPAVELSISGSARIPDEASTPFIARVRYASGVLRDVTALADWSLQPPGVASVSGGIVTVGTLTDHERLLTLRATYAEGSASLAAEKQVRCARDLAAEGPGVWPMFQADSRHTGSLPILLDPTKFSLRWQRNFDGQHPLNPVSAGDGKVFASMQTYFSDHPSLFALRATDGATIWSKDFGNIFSANPPSYAYGNVYIQTGNHSSDTWLHAFDGETGEMLFKAPHGAQWERYFAPTIYAHKIYVNGGQYGGMYAFDAFSGERLWFAVLPFYDQWTPAVADGHVYAYVGDYSPGLYVHDRLTGAQTQFVADPKFQWDGWSMNLAPVVGTHDDLIAIHDGRLISFDTVQGTIRRELQGQYSGQPSVSRGRIYAITNGRLAVRDELSHAGLWTWQPPNENLTGPMIVTDKHLLVSSDANVYAVDLLTHRPAWSYPVSGQLALADNMLYVASTNGTLTAFHAPRDVIFKGTFE